MEDISSFVWLGVAVIWLLTRLVRRGVKKATQSQKNPPRPATSHPAVADTEIPRTRIQGRPDVSGRGGTGPPPIVPH